MDLVAGPAHGSNAALLTLVERKYRRIIVRKIPDKTQAGFLQAIRGIERHYGNRMIRRFVAKGRDIARFTRQAIREIETWINKYPRRIFDFMTPHELFVEQLKAVS